MKNTALITGASNGIGLELARVFATRGHNLILVARSRDRLEALKKELEAAHKVQVEFVAQDLGLSDSARKLFETVKSRGWEVDYLVNNAGFGDFGAFLETSWPKEDQMIRLNVLTLVGLTKHFSQDMAKRKRGRIMNVASTAAFQPGPLMAVYYATKAFVLHFSEAINEEFREHGLSVTALCPGPTQSGFQDAAAMGESRLVKNRRLPTSADVAGYAYRSMMKGKAVAIHGLMNKILAWSVRFTPRFVIVKVARYIQESVN